MEIANRLKDCGVIITYAYTNDTFREGDKFESVDEFVHEIESAVKYDDCKFVGIGKEEDGDDYVLELIEPSLFGRKVKVWFRLIMYYNEEVAKAIEDMVG